MHPSATPPHEVAIEAVAAADAGELLTLQRAAYVPEARLYGDLELPPLTQTLPELAEELASATALKAVAGHRIVGTVRARRDGAVLHIARLAVAPDWQGRGIGSRLLAAVEAAHAGDAETAALFTGHLSATNLALYTRRGYREQRREPLRPGVVLVHLAKPLPARTTAPTTARGGGAGAPGGGPWGAT
jgi:GNAT superfamily N-acetyltransferase